ncbi:hypothetical protein CI784_03250 [Arthrobacter agilis]|nr:hypothetical protein B8W74_02220 [Arthrobacter agilis]PPB47053.1 hypothetical protein CI784_03250 [Arthrobacter agilis]
MSAGRPVVIRKFRLRHRSDRKACRIG